MSKKQSSTASEESLGVLHKLLGDVFLHQVQTELDSIKNDGDGYFSTLSPAMITAILKYLDASSITCAIEVGDEASELAKKMQTLKDKRKSSNILDINNINKAVNED